jgi:tetratricopeptide (TPR) repeat protein
MLRLRRLPLLVRQFPLTIRLFTAVPESFEQTVARIMRLNTTEEINKLKRELKESKIPLKEFQEKLLMDEKANEAEEDEMPMHVNVLKPDVLQKRIDDMKRKLGKSVVESEIPQVTVDLANLMRQLSSLKRQKEALELFEGYVGSGKFPAHTMLYRMAIAACKQDRDLPRALEYLDEMKLKKIPENLEIYHLLIRLCRHAKNVDAAEDLIERILSEKKVTPTDETVALLVHLYTEVDMERGMKFMTNDDRLIKIIEQQMSEEERNEMNQFAKKMVDQANPPKRKKHERLVY